MKTPKLILYDTMVILAVAVLFNLLAFYLTGSKASPTAADDHHADTPTTPRTAVPAELVGAWHHGSVSSLNFNSPNPGSWSNGYGEGLFYKFYANGDFEYGWQVYANTYGCKTQAMACR